MLIFNRYQGQVSGVSSNSGQVSGVSSTSNLKEDLEKKKADLARQEKIIIVSFVFIIAALLAKIGWLVWVTWPALQSSW